MLMILVGKPSAKQWEKPRRPNVVRNMPGSKTMLLLAPGCYIKNSAGTAARCVLVYEENEKLNRINGSQYVKSLQCLHTLEDMPRTPHRSTRCRWEATVRGPQ